MWLGSFPKKSGTRVRASGELGAWTRLGGQGLCLCWPQAVTGLPGGTQLREPQTRPLAPTSAGGREAAPALTAEAGPSVGNATFHGPGGKCHPGSLRNGSDTLAVRAHLLKT